MSKTNRLFLYGTLCDPQLFAIVAGEVAQFKAAKLSDHCVNWVEGQNFPIISHATGSVAEGVVVEVAETAKARLDFYELGFGYDLQSRTVYVGREESEALIYIPNPGRWTPGAPWSLADWQSAHGAFTHEAAKDYMSLFGRLSAAEAAPLFGQIKCRAATRLRAMTRPSPRFDDASPAVEGVEVVSREQPFVGFFALQKDRLRYPRFDGSQSEVVSRETLVGGDAVTVLPFDPVTGNVLVIRQFRHGPFVRGDANPWCLEPVAGRIDPGESATEAAYRELEEEAGLSAIKMIEVSRYYPTPGAFSEHLTNFVALCDLSNADGFLGGEANEHEDIRSDVIPLARLEDLIANGVANTGPLIMSGQWLAANHRTL